VIDYNSIFAR